MTGFRRNGSLSGQSRLFLGNSLDERRTRTHHNHRRLRALLWLRRQIEAEDELPAGNSQEEVDRLPAGNTGTSRSRSESGPLIYNEITTFFDSYTCCFPPFEAVRPCYGFLFSVRVHGLEASLVEPR